MKVENKIKRLVKGAVSVTIFLALTVPAGAQNQGENTALPGEQIAFEADLVGPVISLCDAVKKAVTVNPSVLAVKAARRSATANVKKVRAGFFPSMTMRLGAGPEWSDNSATRSREPGVSDSGSDTLWRTAAGLTLSQMLFDGFETANRVRASRERAGASDYQVLDAGNSVGLAAVETYLDILRYRQLGRLAEKNIRDHRDILEKIRFRANSGGGTVADVRQSEARLAVAETMQVDVSSALRDSAIRYREVIGDMPRHLERPLPPMALMPADCKTAVAVALDRSPALGGAVATVAGRRAEHAVARSAYFPDLFFELSGSKNRNLDGLESRSDDISGMVVLRYNLYQGGRRKAELREAMEAVKEAEFRLKEIRNRTEKQAGVAFNALVTAGSRMPILHKNVRFDEDVLAAYQGQFELGRRSLLDLLNAQNELFQARASLVNGEFTKLFAHYQVLASAGMLLDALEIQAP